jgi:tol-pal system protein YbgF
MNRLPKFASRYALPALIAGTLATAAAAQGGGTVVESQGLTLGGSSSSNSAPQSTAPVSNNDALQLLLDQNRQLQAEVQALRGMVEEQGFEIRRLQRDSLNRYTDMDERLQALESRAASSPASPGSPGSTAISNVPVQSGSTSTAQQPVASNDSTVSASSGLTTPDERTVVTPRSNRPTTSRGTLQPAVLSEQQLYQMAYDSVINSNFELSIAEFDQYLSIYPQGRFVTNAHYWKGQAYLYLNRYTEARDSYEIILNQFSDSAKLPDAMYGLAQAYEGLGNLPQARRLLNDIKRQFPNTGAASLADTRLLTLD